MGGGQIVDETGLAEGFSDAIAGGVVLGECPRSNLAGVLQALLACKELVEQVTDRQTLSLDPQRPSGVEVVPLFDVLLQRAVRVRPWAKVVQTPENLLRPAACGVRE